MLDTFKGATPQAITAIKEEMAVRKTTELFLLFAMGSQTDHLIFRAMAKLGIFCLVADPAKVSSADINLLLADGIAVKGIVVSGGPASVATEPPPFDNDIFDLGIPVLGICLGFQMWAKHIGAFVFSGGRREFGVHDFHLSDMHRSPLFERWTSKMPVLQSHGDHISIERRGGMRLLGVTDRTSVTAGSYRHLFGVQFHPEVSHTVGGPMLFESFVFTICKARDRFPAANEAAVKIAHLKKQIGNNKVLLMLSGGSDSSVVAYLLKAATAGRHQLRGVYMRGVDRPDDEKFVLEYFGNQDWIELKIVDATDELLAHLKGKETMKEKRDAMIDGVYVPLIEREAKDFGAHFVAQGTLYTDISESGGGHQSGARKAMIKRHHNVGHTFSVPELMPLSDCVKDNARDIGRTVGVPEVLLTRHPFPGPGLVVRIMGEITPVKLDMARTLDLIYIEEIRAAGLYDQIWQAGVVLTDSTHTYTKGDNVGTGIIVMNWAVSSVNGFTAHPFDLPFHVRVHISRRYGNEVSGIGATVYRDSGKPYSTIEAG